MILGNAFLLSEAKGVDSMFDYMYEDDVQVMQMIYIPKRLFSSHAYSKLSAKAKVLYALLLGSSEREGMTKPLYSDYSIREICDDLCCSSNEAAELLTELSMYKLIAYGKDRIIVNDFEEREGL